MAADVGSLGVIEGISRRTQSPSTSWRLIAARQSISWTVPCRRYSEGLQVLAVRSQATSPAQRIVSTGRLQAPMRLGHRLSILNSRLAKPSHDQVANGV